MAGLILGALAGAGGQLADYADKQIGQDQKLEALGAESNLALQRAQALEVFKQTLQQAPLERLGTKARDMAGQEVPQEPKRVTSLPAYDPGETSAPASFHGDIGIVQRAVANLPEPDRSAAMEQLRAQVARQQQLEADAVAGKTRKRTNDEALAAAADDAKVNDPVAYAQYEKEIGKPLRDEKRVDTQQQREDNRADLAMTVEQRRADREQRRMLVDLARLDMQQDSLDTQNRRIDALIDHWNRTDDRKDADGGSKPDKLGAIVNSMNTTIKLLVDSGKPTTPEAKAEWQRQYDSAVRVRNRAAALLDESLTERGAPPPATPLQSPTPGPSAVPQPGTRPPLNSFLK